MPLDPVVLIDQTPDVQAEVRASVLTGCERALGSGACIATSESAASAPSSAPYVAVLSWDAEHRTVRIEVRVNGEQLERDLQFQPQDGLLQRGAAAGLVTATLVVQHRLGRLRGERSRPAPPASAASKQREPPAGHAAKPEWRSDAVLFVGPGLEQGPFRLGASGRFSAHGFLGPVFPILSFGYAQSGGEVQARWLRGFVGLGASLERSRSGVHFELSGAWLAERLALSTSDGQRHDGASRFRSGGLLEAALVWEATRQLHCVVGGQLSAAWPRVEITRESRAIGRQSTFGWDLLAGLRLAL